MQCRCASRTVCLAPMQDVKRPGHEGVHGPCVMLGARNDERCAAHGVRSVQKETRCGFLGRQVVEVVMAMIACEFLCCSRRRGSTDEDTCHPIPHLPLSAGALWSRHQPQTITLGSDGMGSAACRCRRAHLLEPSQGRLITGARTSLTQACAGARHASSSSASD